MVGKRHETCTPTNIADLTENEILELAKLLSDVKSPMKVRLAVLKKMYELLNFNLSNDLLLALLADVKHQLVLACAGGCKTTSSQIVIILAKILWNKVHGRHLTASEILCLVYNRENRPQMDKKHADMLTPMIMTDFLTYDSEKSHYINAGITSHTLHSFCKHWIDQYLPELNMAGYTMVKEQNIATFFGSAIKNVKKRFGNLKDDIRVDRVETLYDLMYELCLTAEDLDEKNPLLSDAIFSCNARVEHLREIFKAYENQKRFFRSYDFIDMLTCMNRLLDNSEVAHRMHLLYSFIVVDEIQDFTPLMMSILKKIVGPDTRLLAIGDEDQSIYGFRGADVNNAVRFTTHFPESKVFQLLVNRRCGENILEQAAKVINLNTNRYEKHLVAERPNGEVHVTPYVTMDQQMSNILSAVLATPKEERNSTVVAVREKLYGQPITFNLFVNRIPYHTFNATGFQYHEAFRGIVEIMNLVWKPNRDNWRNLYKIVNIKRSEWFEYIGFDEKKQKPVNFPGKENLWDLGFEPFMHYAGLKAALDELLKIHKRINSSFCSEYLDYIIKLFKLNFWESRIALEPLLFSEEVFNWIRAVFNKSAPYPVLYSEYSERLQTLSSDQRYKSGVTVATMHALKGLEFKHAHLAFLEDQIFPGFSSIESKNYPMEIATALREAENRLAYVAMTRAKDHLHLHYSTVDPSFYISLTSSTPTAHYTEPLVFSTKKKW